MKRFASHYVYTSSLGFLKQHVVEINNEGVVVAIYRLEEEIESVIWTPGVIRLVPHDCIPDQLSAIRLYPFDFSEMKVTAETVAQPLGHAVF